VVDVVERVSILLWNASSLQTLHDGYCVTMTSLCWTSTWNTVQTMSWLKWIITFQTTN